MNVLVKLAVTAVVMVGLLYAYKDWFKPPVGNEMQHHIVMSGILVLALVVLEFLMMTMDKQGRGRGRAPPAAAAPVADDE